MASIAPLPPGAHPCVWLLCGGPSSEYDVSLASARGVLAAFDYARFCVRLVCLSPDGRWLIAPHPFYDSGEPELVEGLFALLQHPDSYPLALPVSQALAVLEDDSPVAAFNAMHGRVGEDGVMQGLFTLLGVPMTGSGVEASALAMDKARARELFRAAGLDVPRALVYEEQPGRERPSAFDIMEKVGFPCIVKPARGGSSLGVTIVRFARDFEAALERALVEGESVALIEEFVRGQELTCGVLEMKGKPAPLAVTLIRPRGEFFDYKSKYIPGEAEEITPAPLGADDTFVVQSAAMMAHRALGCSGYSRADFILADDGRLVILEVNTLPGMTKTSLLPQGAAAKGISFTSLINYMVAAALRRGRRELAHPLFTTAATASEEYPAVGNRRQGKPPLRQSA